MIAPPADQPCPCCGASSVEDFHEAEGVPVNSVLLLPTREEAVRFPTGDIVLGFCRGCGFIYNRAFRPELLEYSSRYEETQGFSPTFQEWQRTLAEDLIQRYDLRGKRLLEIGCGKGEFLTLLCDLGENSGVGFDPAYIPERNQGPGRDRIEFVRDFYSEAYSDYEGDFFCCKMTLEHIGPTCEFLSMVRRSLGDRRDTVVYFQVPDVLRILRDLAFWDIYYEHCSYFSPGSLARLFRRCGFEVVEVAGEYDGQYIRIEARPAREGGTVPPFDEEDLPRVGSLVDSFRERLPEHLGDWRRRLQGAFGERRRTVIWGAGSKGVSFLTTLGLREGIEFAVDINPHKQGCFMAGTGQEIVGPEALKELRPDRVVVMNAVYRQEIQRELGRLGLDPEVLTT